VLAAHAFWSRNERRRVVSRDVRTSRGMSSLSHHKKHPPRNVTKLVSGLFRRTGSTCAGEHREASRREPSSKVFTETHYVMALKTLRGLGQPLTRVEQGSTKNFTTTLAYTMALRQRSLHWGTLRRDYNYSKRESEQNRLGVETPLR
jgi:hypothetical protein